MTGSVIPRVEAFSADSGPDEAASLSPVTLPLVKKPKAPDIPFPRNAKRFWVKM